MSSILRALPAVFWWGKYTYMPHKGAVLHCITRNISIPIMFDQQKVAAYYSLNHYLDRSHLRLFLMGEYITGLHFYDSTLFGRKVSLNVNFPPPWLGDPAFSTQLEQRPFYNTMHFLLYMHSFLILDDFLMLKFP